MRALVASSLVAGVLACGLVGCIVEPAPRKNPQPNVTPPVGTTAPTPTTPPTTTPPLKIAIDKGKTLVAQPGDGAGVFITYPGEGRWAIQWTCDTNYSGRSCNYEMAIGVNNLSSLTATPADVVEKDETGFRIHATSGKTLDSAQFLTDPGASITVSVWLDGAPIGNSVFFVSNGKLSTEPVDPIELVPNVP